MKSDTMENGTAGIARAFERPEWYLRGFATNIRIRVETVNAMVTTFPGARMLDVGCGDGSLSLPFLRKGCQVTFLDRSQAMLDIVASRLEDGERPQVKFVNSDFNEGDFEASSLDIVFCVGVLAYVTNLDDFVRKVASVLKPGGQLVIECTNASHILGKLQRAYNNNWIGRMLRPRPFVTVLQRKCQVIAAVSSAGFDLRGTYEYTHSLPLVSRFTPSLVSEKSIRRVFGFYPDNRRAFLGTECLMYFVRKG